MYKRSIIRKTYHYSSKKQKQNLCTLFLQRKTTEGEIVNKSQTKNNERIDFTLPYKMNQTKNKGFSCRQRDMTSPPPPFTSVTMGIDPHLLGTITISLFSGSFSRLISSAKPK